MWWVCAGVMAVVVREEVPGVLVVGEGQVGMKWRWGEGV